MDELAQVLDREQRQLELLLFRLVSARQLSEAGETRFLPWAAAEVERTLERVHEAELVRGVVTDRLAAYLGLDAERVTLRDLAELTGEPVRTVLLDHRATFLRLLAEIDEATRWFRLVAAA